MKKLRLLLRFLGFNTWDSWSGFGVSLSWPGDQKKYESEIGAVKSLSAFLLGDECIVRGPAYAAGGAMVIYVWPKSDPKIKNFSEEDVKATE